MVNKEAPLPGYETKDTNFWAIFSLAGLLVMLLGTVLLVSRLMDERMVPQFRGPTRPVSPLARFKRVPPNPRLQINSAVDLIRLRDVEDVTLNHYGWIDPDAGTVRIPIARAMQLLAQEGLPARRRTNEETQ